MLESEVVRGVEIPGGGTSSAGVKGEGEEAKRKLRCCAQLS